MIDLQNLEERVKALYERPFPSEYDRKKAMKSWFGVEAGYAKLDTPEEAIRYIKLVAGVK